MPSQSVSWQRRMLQRAQDERDADLYFFLELTRDGRTLPAVAGGIVPVVQVGEEYDTAPEWAHLLLEVARLCTPGAQLATALTTRQLLDEAVPGRWREWVPVDVVCPFCGTINCPADCLPAGYSLVRAREAPGEDS